MKQLDGLNTELQQAKTVSIYLGKLDKEHILFDNFQYVSIIWFLVSIMSPQLKGVGHIGFGADLVGIRGCVASFPDVIF